MKRLETTVSTTGTTTIPKSVRDALGLSTGGRIEWHPGTDGTVVVRVKHRYIAGRVIETSVTALARPA